MAEKITNIKERILYFIEYKGINKEDFFNGLNEITYGSFKGASKRSALNSNAVAEIVTKYPEINLVWLITGKGEMLVKNKVTRLLEFIKHENIDRKTFAEKTKIDFKIINNLEKFEDLNYDIFDNVFSLFPELNEEWILFGNGNMLKQKESLVYERSSDKVNEQKSHYSSPKTKVSVSNEEIVELKLAPGYILSKVMIEILPKNSESE